MYKYIKSKIEHTVMQERYNEKEELINYVIVPSEGYLLHEKSRDELILDEKGNETGEIVRGYTGGIITVMADYDFEKNEREIYAIGEEEYESKNKKMD